jgi:tetratricopeptide (TPR) repeat protein
MPTSSLVTVAKKVIREAGKMGLQAGKVVLDEAGSRVCGPTAWKYLKKILSPVVAELEKRFPKLLLVPEEADKGAEALSKDAALQDMLHSGFAKLESGQEEILAALARQNETLTGIGEAIDTGFLEVGRKLDGGLDAIGRKLRALEFQIADLNAAPEGEVGLGLSIAEINDQAGKLQWDAMKWVVAGDAKTASQRLAEARGLLEAGLRRAPGHAAVLVCFGFVQKTQAQVAQLEGNHQEYVDSLAEAAKYFGEVLRSDSTNVGALNGMANIYIFDKDYDRAIQLGTLAAHKYPNYGAAWWDLAIALENKMGLIGQTPELVQHLKSVYRSLQVLMPKQPQAFTASELAHVQGRLAALEKL